MIAGGIGTIIGIFVTEGLVFKTAFAITYLAVVWICLEAVRIPELRDLIKQGYETTMRITTMVAFILIGSTCFSVVFLGVSGGVWLEHLLTSLPGGVWGFLIFINLFIFFLAFFLDFFEIAFIILPMIAPIAQKILAPVVGPDAALIWFGVMLCVNMQTSFMHPPFGFALFYLRGVAPERGQELRHLLGRAALGRIAGDHGRPRDRVPDHGHRLARQARQRRPEQDQDRRPADGVAAAGLRAAGETIARAFLDSRERRAHQLAIYCVVRIF